jgi:ABC-2 type transport system permease protein
MRPLLTGYAAGVRAIFVRDLLLFLSYRWRVLAQMLSAFFSIALFYYLSRLVRVSVFRSSDEYFGFAVVGLVILEVVASTLTIIPTKVRQELVAGTFERLVLSPLGPVAAIASMTVFPVLLALLLGSVSIAFAAIVFGMPLAWPTAFLSIPAALLGAAAFAPFTLLVAAGVLLFKQAAAGAGFIVTGLSLVGGFLFPVALLPSWIRWVSDIQPFTPAVNLLRHLLIGTSTGSAWLEVLKLVLFTLALFPLTVAVLAAAVRAGQRRGTIIEY